MMSYKTLFVLLMSLMTVTLFTGCSSQATPAPTVPPTPDVHATQTVMMQTAQVVARLTVDAEMAQQTPPPLSTSTKTPPPLPTATAAPPSTNTPAPTPTTIDTSTPTVVPTEEPTATLAARAARPPGHALTLIPVVESPHPYPNQYDESWIVSNSDPQAEATRLHFSRLQLEENVDWLIIMDGHEVEMQRITSAHPDGIWTELVPGNIIKLRLVTDKSVRDWGFAVNAIESGPYTTLAYSPHPYPHNAELKWNFSNLDANASATRLHFSRLDLEENVDWLVIMDAYEKPYQWITGSYPDGLWTIGVPGNSVVIKLISDSSVNGWGFNMDALETTSPAEAQPRPEPMNALAESPHPYHDAQSWTLVNPNPKAAFTKVHFTRLSINPYGGRLVLYDGNGNTIQTFGRDTHLQDFWSDDIPGRVVKIELNPDGYGDHWGFRIDRLADGEPKPSLAESPHPYHNAQNWTLVNPNPKAVFTKVHFTRLSINPYGGRLVLYDGNGNPVQTFGEDTHLRDVWSDDIPGRVVKIELNPDGYGDYWGFRIDRLADGEPKPSLAESPHPYHDAQNWTLVNPNPKAVFTKVHFTRLSINPYGGRLVLYDGNGNPVQTFGEDTHLRDVWSDDIPGRVVKIELNPDGYGDYWGFRIDDIAPKAEETPAPAFVSAVYIHIAQPGTLSLNDTPLGCASAPGDYRVVLPGIGEQHITVESLFYQQQIVVDTDEKGTVNVTYQPIQTK